MKLNLQRTVKHGKFIPEIDGLRFLAIVSVVLFHLNTFITQKDIHDYSITQNNDNILFTIARNGSIGVQLFFILSGFVLGLPFAKWYVLKEQPVKIKRYFLRRLIRLEPPYIIVMTVLGFACVYIAKTMNLHEALFSYIASIFYMHNFFYPGHLPHINVVAWSLEIEVQFYILAPLLALIFKIQNTFTRRITILIAIFFSISLNAYIFHLPVLSILDELHFFLLGFLLVDLYIHKPQLKIIPNKRLILLISTVLFASLWLINRPFVFHDMTSIIKGCCLLIITGIFYYIVIIAQWLPIFKYKWITNIGGMCYSIYLIHYAVISLVGNQLLKYQFSEIQWLNQGLYALILSSCVLICSTVFYKLVEQPFMRKKI